MKPPVDPRFQALERRPLRRVLSVLLGLVALTLFVGLRSARSEQQRARPAQKAATKHPTPPSSQAAVARAPDGIVWFEGACDASGAVEVDRGRLAVADDEDDVIRVYDAKRGGPPLFQHDFSQRLGARDRPGVESDFEAATRWNDHAFFLSSHGRTRKGALDRDRFVFFASEIPTSARAPALVGQPYRSLLRDMLKDPRLKGLGLEAAALVAPKEPGGLNIEGLTAAPDGSFWIGFRNPVPEGRALLVRLKNPPEVLAGRPARFDEPVRLELGGLGIRALTALRSDVLLVAGPSSEAGPFRLYRYDGRTRAEVLPAVDFGDLNPEGFFSPDSANQVLVLSDDGSRQIDGKRCKKLKDSTRKRFRGKWLTLQGPE